MRFTAWLGMASFAIFICTLSAQAKDDASTLVVKKTATCGCCLAWVTHMEAAGFKAKPENLPFSVLSKFKRDHGVKSELASCHTGKIGGYVIEGHVPAREVTRLLRERPDAIGLSVPGMPVGSPGMEVDNTRDAFDVMLIRRDGSTSVFAHYPAKN